MAPLTDFEEYGLDRGALSCPERASVITVDFEAFQPSAIDLWCDAMRHWAERQREHELSSEFFISVEDVVRLREADGDGYERFLKAARDLHRSGTTFYPHNHCVFDLSTGERPTPPDVLKTVPGYNKRASMYYDAVYRNGLDFVDWMPQVVEAYDGFLRDLGVGRPARLVFRPGGWDHGSSREDLEAYLDALRRVGVHIESGASSGVYGTSSCRVGAKFGTNLFKLEGGIYEVAPSWFLDCGAGTVSPQFLGAMLRLVPRPVWRARRRKGAFVMVLHFDHLFHSGWGPTHQYFSVEDTRQVRARVDHAFKQLTTLNRMLAIKPTSFADLELVNGRAGEKRPAAPDASVASL